MAKKKTAKKTTKKSPTRKRARGESMNAGGAYSYCALPQAPKRVFGADVSAARAEMIIVSEQKWVNGTVLHYYFFDRDTDGKKGIFSDGTSEFRPWTTTDEEKEVVRTAFANWKGLGIGLQFAEVHDRNEAEIRIGFMRGDGAWSYIGREILNQGRDQRTMNFGWDLTRSPRELDTAMHEIGHTLGFPHEHQNPNAGIVWDEEAVYASLAQPPNSWPREKTLYNIIRKIDPDTVQGSNWDFNSIMHYPFEAGLIKVPEQFRNGLEPAGGLSERDKTWVKTFYPPLSDEDHIELKAMQSEPFSIAAGQQMNFTFEPDATRNYEIRTFGESDTVMVLFEDDTEPRYMTADDDSGEDRNAYIRTQLVKGRKYIIRVRLYYAEVTGNTAIMVW